MSNKDKDKEKHKEQESTTSAYSFGIDNNANDTSNSDTNTNKFIFGIDDNAQNTFTFRTNNSVTSETNDGFTFGKSNVVSSGTNNNIIFGTNNNVSMTTARPATFGTSNNVAFGTSNNVAFGTSNNVSFGTNNNAAFAFVPSNNDPQNNNTLSTAFVSQPIANSDNNDDNDNSNNSNNSNSNSSSSQAAITPPTINENDIDPVAQMAFLMMFAEQTKNQWCCSVCNNYNPQSTNKCEACNIPSNKPQLIQTPCIAPDAPVIAPIACIPPVDEDSALYSYYNVLNENNEILEYEYPSHPKPRYFPYMHDDKEEELKEEGVEAWTQFDSYDNDNENEKIRTYYEYKKRRGLCSEQLRHTRIAQGEVVIAMTGDGSMCGQLGVGNGSITNITNNVSPFPFILKHLAHVDIKYTTAGIMSTAAVTTDNQLYVWGLNDKSELTINPHDLEDVDVGDDDDQLSPHIAWDRLYHHYLTLITDIYARKNPQKLAKQGFAEQLLLKRKVGQITMSYRDKVEVKQGSLYNENQIKKIIQQFEDKCRLEEKKTKKGMKAKWDEEIDIEQSAHGMHRLYIAVCDTYDIHPSQSEAFMPKATEQEMKQRKERKLNPCIEAKSNAYEEDNFQNTLSCSYWTPTRVRLPYKMVIKEVSLGGTHMVVLDDLGQVWSSGTFTNDGPIGHHYDPKTKQIMRYQRTLKKISNIESPDGGSQRSRIGKNNTLPAITSIASGANHFLMLDKRGNIWTMGVSKLGQRWCERNTARYLSPKLVSIIKSARNKREKKRIKFVKIACGNYHNVAISKERRLYSWGQNIWLQCAHDPEKCGYGNVVDHPRCVPFYENKKNMNDPYESNVVVIDCKVKDVVAGEHLTVALDTNGKVWTCGRNARGALGRKTRSEGVKDYGAQKVQTEVKPDFMRKVSDLEHINVDWIGCGSVVWFAHNSKNGAVYTFGDASSGRAGIGQWKCARGRTVFDEHNLETHKYEVIAATGGSDHVIFSIKRKKIKRRQTMFGSNINSRESSISLEESGTNGFNGKPNFDSNNQRDPTEIGFNPFSNVPSTNKVLSRTQSRKRKREVMIVESNLDEIDENGEVPAAKRPRLNKSMVIQKPQFTVKKGATDSELLKRNK